MSFTEQALRSKKAREAIGAGVVDLISSGDLQQGIDKMLDVGKKNGSAGVVAAGLLLDLLTEIQQDWKVTGTRRSRKISV